MYNYRYIQEIFIERPRLFRAILITGPRRSGKSTLCKKLQESWGTAGSYVSFDTPLEQARFQSDPQGFLRSLKVPVVLDEVQNVPELFNYLKVLIDEQAEGGCDYILTGSQNFQMMHKVSESLAGRILVKELLPFSLGEIREAPSERIKKNLQSMLTLHDEFDIEKNAVEYFQRDQVLSLLSRGGFPPAALSDNENERLEWFHSYVETYVQRDLRALSNVQNLSSFTRFVSLVAGRTAQMINYSELGKDIGINYKTAQHYLSLLEASYLWRTLVPYYKHSSEKRLTKSPKGIFLDTGLAMFLAGVHPSTLERNQLLGNLFETLVIGECIKLCAAFGHKITPCHFRAGESSEVDLVLEYGSTLVPIEIKCSATPDSSWGRGIQTLRKVAGLSESHTGYVLSLAPEVRPIAPGILNVPLSVLY